MKMFMVLGALVIPLMFTGCNFIKINIIAGSGIEQAEDGGPGRLPSCGTLNNPPHPPPYNCDWNSGCTCLPGSYPPPP